MEIKIVLLLTLLLYSVIVSQSFSYIISLRNVQQLMNAGEYITFRKRTDRNYNAKFRWVIYASLLCNLALVILAGYYGPRFLFASALFSMIALLADTGMAVKGNIPINKTINTWTPEQYPQNWAGYRSSWLRFFSIRQVLNITGFTILLIATVFS